MDTMKTDRTASPKRAWEAPVIQRLGTFGAVMRGGSRPLKDSGTAFRKVANGPG